MPLAELWFAPCGFPCKRRSRCSRCSRGGECCARSARTGCCASGLAFRRWGTTPAGAFTVNAITRADQTALIDDEGPVTCAELERRTNALARGLAELGLEPGERIGILCRNGVALRRVDGRVRRSSARTR